MVTRGHSECTFRHDHHATPCFRYVYVKVVRFRCIRSNGNARKRHETGNGNTGYPSCFRNGLTCFCHVSVYGFLQFRPVIPPKIKFEILAHRGSQTTSPHARRLLVSSNRKQWNNCTSWRQWRWIKILDRSVERWGGRHNNEQSCQRQRKPAVKMEKPENVLRSKTTNRQTTFKITIRGDCWCLCIQASIKKRKPRFQHCVWQSLVGRRLLCSKYGRQRGAPTLHVSFTKEIFSFLYRMVLFLSSLGLFFLFSFFFY